MSFTTWVPEGTSDFSHLWALKSVCSLHPSSRAHLGFVLFESPLFMGDVMTWLSSLPSKYLTKDLELFFPCYWLICFRMLFSIWCWSRCLCLGERWKEFGAFFTCVHNQWTNNYKFAQKEIKFVFLPRRHCLICEGHVSNIFLQNSQHNSLLF